MNGTDLVTLYLHKRSFIVTFKVPSHMCTSFSIIIRYIENISSHGTPIIFTPEIYCDFYKYKTLLISTHLTLQDISQFNLITISI